MKRLTALVLAILAILLLVPQTVLAADDGGESFYPEEFNGVKIVFNVGDSTLSVNDKEITVETPYIVDGVTLVPVRVITEAFGADVGWDQETKTVTITYSGVVIKLIIGEKNAYINDVKTELLAAPELKNSTTMVPLRFITESFGADVTFDEETKGITVTKEMTESNSIKDFALIMKHSKKERVGDSYLGWSIKKTADMTIDSRSFNGESNYFSVSDSGSIDINITPLSDEDNDLDYYMDKLKDSSKYYTVMDYEKAKSPSGINYAKLQYKTSYSYTDERYYIANKKVYYISIYTYNTDGIKAFKELSELADSFDLTFDEDTTEDLSDVDKETKLRVYNSKDMALCLAIPGDFSIESNYGTINKINFESSENNYKFPDEINISVYSSFENHSYQTWADYDYKKDMDNTNSKYFTYSQMGNTTIDGKKALTYEQQMKYKSICTTKKDFYIDAGDYFYNISISLCDNDTSSQVMQRIIDSIKIGKIDGEEIGKMIRTDNTEAVKYKEYTEPTTKLKLSVPNTWHGSAAAGSMFFTTEDSNGAFIAETKDISKETGSFSEICESMYDTTLKGSIYESVEMKLTEQNGLGDEAYSFEILMDIGDAIGIDDTAGIGNISIYGKGYFVKKGETLYLYLYLTPEIYWSTRASETFDNIVKAAQYNR